MRKKPTTKTLKRKLDKALSLMVRKRDYDYPCISCGLYGELQCGHYVKRKPLATRWHPWNVNGECAKCNGFDDMHLVRYSRNLDVRRGDGTAMMLEKFSHTHWKPLPDQLERLILACDSPEDYEEEWFLIQREFAPEVQ